MCVSLLVWDWLLFLPADATYQASMASPGPDLSQSERGGCVLVLPLWFGLSVLSLSSLGWVGGSQLTDGFLVSPTSCPQRDSTLTSFSLVLFCRRRRSKNTRKTVTTVHLRLLFLPSDGLYCKSLTTRQAMFPSLRLVCNLNIISQTSGTTGTTGTGDGSVAYGSVPC